MYMPHLSGQDFHSIYVCNFILQYLCKKRGKFEEEYPLQIEHIDAGHITQTSCKMSNAVMNKH